MDGHAKLNLVLSFSLRGLSGSVRVTVEPNLDPVRWGCGTFLPQVQLEAALGFPVCRAVVEHSGEGYMSLSGWVQLVRSGPPGRVRWELDPLALLRGLDLPFAFFGFAPMLFDAPMRQDRSVALDWAAHSFLCAVPTLGERIVVPLVGFRWGFQVCEGKISIERPSALALNAWDEHLQILQRGYPSWTFCSASTGGRISAV